MDERLQKAFEIADYMSTLSSQKTILKEEYAQDLLFYHNGGSFELTQEFLSFVKLLIDCKQLEDTALIDKNDIPVNVAKLDDFFIDALSAYTEATNKYYNKYQALIKNRTVEKLVDIYDE